MINDVIITISCIWNNLLFWLEFCSQIQTFNFTTIQNDKQMRSGAILEIESETELTRQFLFHLDTPKNHGIMCV